MCKCACVTASKGHREAAMRPHAALTHQCHRGFVTAAAAAERRSNHSERKRKRERERERAGPRTPHGARMPCQLAPSLLVERTYTSPRRDADRRSFSTQEADSSSVSTWTRRLFSGPATCGTSYRLSGVVAHRAQQQRGRAPESGVEAGGRRRWNLRRW